MSKEVSKSEVITSEVVDKFHRVLCPHCNGRCFNRGFSCSYDYGHKSEEVPNINKIWTNYITALSEMAKSYNMTLDEAYELLTTVKPLSEEKLDIKYEMQELFRKFG